jgi:hypothetical protein
MIVDDAVAHRICFNVVVDIMAVLREHGMLLASAKGPIPNVAELVVGEPIRGSWWAHPRSHEIYAVLTELEDSPEVVRLRLIRGKITLVHRRIWPALVRLSDRFPDDALAAVDQQDAALGEHRTVKIPFPAWVPPEVIREAARLSEHEALDQMPAPALIAAR